MLVEISGAILAFIPDSLKEAYFAVALSQATKAAILRRDEATASGGDPWPPELLTRVVLSSLCTNLGATFSHHPGRLDLEVIEAWWELQHRSASRTPLGDPRPRAVQVPRSCYEAFLLSRAKKF